MLNLPRFKPHLRVEVVPGEGAFVVSGAQQTLLKGQLYELVVPLVGDGRSADALCDALGDRTSPAEVFFVLNQLEAKGFLCEEGGFLPDDEASLWSAQQVDPAEAVRRLEETRVSLQSIGVDVAAFAASLGAARVRLAPDAPLGVVVADGYLNEELSDYNAAALRTSRPWLLVKPYGRSIWLGPLFQPGVTGCWQCLADRLRANRPVESYLASRNGRVAPPRSTAHPRRPRCKWRGAWLRTRWPRGLPAESYRRCWARSSRWT